MKKFLALFLCALALASLFALPACDGKSGGEEPQKDWTNNY